MTPIAKLELGIDEDSGLTKELHTWQLTCDTKSEVIVVVYDIVLISPTGRIVKVLETNSYKRIEDDFNKIRESPIGIQIAELVQKNINNYPKL